MRVLLATEGPGDEEVAARLITRCLGPVTIKSMSLPARGLPAILRQVSDFVRAAYFGHYDLLVVHFDMDDTLPNGFTYARQSTRWIDINLRIDNTLAGLTHRREAPIEDRADDTKAGSGGVAVLGSQ